MDNPNIEVYKEDNSYTVVIDEFVFAMNANPQHYQHGVNQYVGQLGVNGIEREAFGDQIPLEDVPEEVREAIEDRIEQEG